MIHLTRTLLWGLFFATTFSFSYGQVPTKEDFDTWNTQVKQATQVLSQVKTTEELPKALEGLAQIQAQLEAHKNLESLLALTPETCPQELKESYALALKLQREFQDSGKRLSMGGILKEGKDTDRYRQFVDRLHLQEAEEAAASTHEGAPPESAEARKARMKWWREGKFGMFIHYGLYSGLAGEVKGKKYAGCVEWIQQYADLDNEEYAREALPKFNPKSGKAAEWVALAKEAGCTYTVLTSRHHEGFNLFETKHSDFNVKKLKGVDVVKEYSSACQKNDVKAGYYVSLLDWSHPDYDPTGSGISYPAANYAAQKAGKRQFGKHEKYKEYLYNIVDDLITKYPVDLIWWDFSQPNFQGDKAWGATQLMANCFKKNPQLVQNNRLYHSANHLSEGGIKVTPTWKGDYSTAEHHIPATGIDGDWEACQTLNGTWGYSADNQKWKSSKALIHELIDTVSRGGNFLLNLGPEPDGSIPAESSRLFKEIGAWMKLNGEAIYGTQSNPLDIELTWGRLTRKGEALTYIFVYEKPGDHPLIIPCTFEGAVKASVLGSGQSIPVSQDKEKQTTSFDINAMPHPDSATVIKVEGQRVLPTKQ